MGQPFFLWDNPSSFGAAEGVGEAAAAAAGQAGGRQLGRLQAAAAAIPAAPSRRSCWSVGGWLAKGQAWSVLSEPLALSIASHCLCFLVLHK